MEHADAVPSRGGRSPINDFPVTDDVGGTSLMKNTITDFRVENPFRVNWPKVVETVLVPANDLMDITSRGRRPVFARTQPDCCLHAGMVVKRWPVLMHGFFLVAGSYLEERKGRERKGRGQHHRYHTNEEY